MRPPTQESIAMVQCMCAIICVHAYKINTRYAELDLADMLITDPLCVSRTGMSVVVIPSAVPEVANLCPASNER